MTARIRDGIVAVGLSLIIGGLAYWWMVEYDAQLAAREEHSAVNEDGADSPGESLPPCTDQIADTGGLCEGPLLEPCPTEDSDGCYWDADTMGNGEGSDVINLRDGVAIIPQPHLTDGVNDR